MSRLVRNFLEMVPVADVGADRAGITAAHFTPEEAASISRRHHRTVAGLLALKRALGELFFSLSGGRAFTEREFVLGHAKSGAPRLVRSPALFREGAALDPGRVRISISHTRAWAYGLAVWQEDADE